MQVAQRVMNNNKKSPLFIIGMVALSTVSFFFIVLGFGLLKLIGNNNNISSSAEKLAIIEVKGVITDSSEIIKQIKKYNKDDSVKGVLLRVNTPGGAVAPSQEIYSELLKLKKNKKIVTSMSTLAASGGYYIACATDKIYANPGTITGSIGVIINLSDLSTLMKKVGIKSNIIKSGTFKDAGSPGRELTKEDRKIFQSVVDDVYNQFVDAVSLNRNLEVSVTKKIADGRIYSGSQAKELGLVDELGSIEDAISDLAVLSGITGEPNIVQEKPDRGLIYKLFKAYFDTSIDVINTPLIRGFSIQYLLPY